MSSDLSFVAFKSYSLLSSNFPNIIHMLVSYLSSPIWQSVPY